MNIEKIIIKDLPVLYIKNFYSKDSHDVILDAMINMNPYEWHTDGSKTGGAKTLEGESLKHNYCLQVDDLVSREGRKYHPILKNTRSIFNPEILDLIEEQHTFFSYIRNSNSDATFINYYEGSSHYDFHKDICAITAVSTFYKTPKMYEQGEFLLEDKVLDLQTGSILIFPPFFKHKASQAICKENGKCYGRFSVAQLIVCK